MAYKCIHMSYCLSIKLFVCLAVYLCVLKIQEEKGELQYTCLLKRHDMMEQPKETDNSDENLVSGSPRDQFHAVYQTFMQKRECKRKKKLTFLVVQL